MSPLSIVAPLAAAAAWLPAWHAAALDPGQLDGLPAALAAGDECGAAPDGSCALAALQRRGAALAAEAAPGSCEHYGCVGYVQSHGCQCNAACSRHGNCCADYTSRCAGPKHPPRVRTARPFGHPRPGKRYPQRRGFTLFLVEEFDQPLDLDSDPIWTWSDGGLENEGQVRFVKDAITFVGGHMHLTVDHYKGQHIHSCSMAEKGHVSRKPFTGGEFRTRHNIFRYGFYEARIRAPSVRPGDPHTDGNYIASFFVFRDSKFDHWREIDFEVLGDSPAAYSTNLISADHTGTWRQDIQDFQVWKGRQGVNMRRGFHTIGFEWLPHRVRWFLDGTVVREYRGERLPIPDMSSKIMMNLWIFKPSLYPFGGSKLYNNRYPLHAAYDWFRFYKWDGDKHYPCPAMDASCLTDGDRRLASNNPCDGIAQAGGCRVSC